MLDKFVKKGNFLMIKGYNGKGEAILSLEQAKSWVDQLNNKYPNIHHEYFEDQWSHLYFIKFYVKEQENKKIVITI